MKLLEMSINTQDTDKKTKGNITTSVGIHPDNYEFLTAEMRKNYSSLTSEINKAIAIVREAKEST